MVADMEAGIGMLTRLPEASLDLALVVVDSSVKSIEVGRRALEILLERKVGPAIVVANRIRDEADARLVRDRLGVVDVVEIPEDAMIQEADRHGLSIVDAAGGAPAMSAAGELAARILRGLPAA